MPGLAIECSHCKTSIEAADNEEALVDLIEDILVHLEEHHSLSLHLVDRDAIGERE